MLLGAKRTSPLVMRMSANDPNRTSSGTCEEHMPPHILLISSQAREEEIAPAEIHMLGVRNMRPLITCRTGNYLQDVVQWFTLKPCGRLLKHDLRPGEVNHEEPRAGFKLVTGAAGVRQ